VQDLNIFVTTYFPILTRICHDCDDLAFIVDLAFVVDFMSSAPMMER
jgi:hypothetical protein